jgi:hypothetical protein
MTLTYHSVSPEPPECPKRSPISSDLPRRGGTIAAPQRRERASRRSVSTTAARFVRRQFARTTLKVCLPHRKDCEVGWAALLGAVRRLTAPSSPQSPCLRVKNSSIQPLSPQFPPSRTRNTIRHVNVNRLNLTQLSNYKRPASVETQSTDIKKHDNIVLWKRPVSASGGEVPISARLMRLCVVHDPRLESGSPKYPPGLKS